MVRSNLKTSDHELVVLNMVRALSWSTNDGKFVLIAFITAIGIWTPVYLNFHFLSRPLVRFVDESIKQINITQLSQNEHTHINHSDDIAYHLLEPIIDDNPLCHNFSFAMDHTQNKDVNVYNCSRPSIIGDIAFISMHHKAVASRSTWVLDVSRAIHNHLSYIRNNHYIYFYITNYSKHLFGNLRAFTGKEILLMKPYLIHYILTHNPNLRYLIWLDFDTLFFNCSRVEQAIIKKAYTLYQYHADIIFSYEPTTVANTGVVVYANTKWTRMFLQRMIAMCLKFESIVERVHRGWADQNIFIASVMGYNDVRFNYSNDTRQYMERLRSDIRLGNEPADTNQTWRWLGDNDMSQILHQSLDSDIRKHVSLLSPFDMNLGFRYYNDKGSKKLLPYEPFIVHFAGPPSKPFISSNAPSKYRNAFNASVC